MFIGRNHLTFFFFLSLICFPSLIWSAEFEVARDNETAVSEPAEYEEDFDSVFDDPAEDIIVQQPADINYRQQFEESKKIVVKGKFLVRGGGGVGWNDDDFSDSPEEVAGAYSKATISFDARPDSTMRVYGQLKTDMNSENGNDKWSPLAISELFCEYNWLDKAFFRIGKYSMKWGQGRLFEPGNFMKDADEGTALRLSMPNVLDGVSLVALYKQRNTKAKDKELHPEDMTYAGLADKTIGPINFSAGFLYNKEDGERYLGSVKTVVFQTDLFADFVLNHYKNYKDLDYTNDYPLGYTKEMLFGFYREWGKSPFFSKAKLYGEYYYDNRLRYEPDHCFGLASDFDNLFGSPVGMAFKWIHSTEFDSGQFLGGFSIAPWKHVKIRFAVPYRYGDKELDNDFFDEFPITSRLAFTLFVEISSDF